MHNYDFSSLNDKEFEVLSNDLIGNREGVAVDRYKAGKDKGVDGRFFVDGSGDVIIQSKHWLKNGVASLLRHLKNKEVEKVTKLNPKRYILSTSLELSREDKKKVIKLFDPYILSENDIVGKENLNYLLSQYPEIEKNHFKLWLSSSEIINNMMNNGIIQISRSRIEDMVASSCIFHETKDFGVALEHLRKKRVLIISGAPGIGKTTLGEQIFLNIIKAGFAGYVLEEEIKEGDGVFDPSKKQIFIFDDFLGHYYQEAFSKNSDSKIVHFIDRIAKSSNKYFILTSRSSILRFSLFKSEVFRRGKNKRSDYELKVEGLSRQDKSIILYNHIWHRMSDDALIREIYKNDRYLEIIDHKNYNPRLISFVTNIDIMGHVDPSKYWKRISYLLNHPSEMWDGVFRGQISEDSIVLACLVTCVGGGIDEEVLRTSFEKYQSLNSDYSMIGIRNRYNEALAVSLKTIFNREISNKINKIVLFNPSVGDYVMENYLNNSNSLISFLVSISSYEAVTSLVDHTKNKKLTKMEYRKSIETFVQVNLENFDNPNWYLGFLRVFRKILKFGERYDNTANRCMVTFVENIDLYIEEHLYDTVCVVNELAKRPGTFLFDFSEFLEKSIKNISNIDEVSILSVLVKEIEESGELFEELKEIALNVFCEEIGYMINENDVALDYFNDFDENEIHREIEYFIRDSFDDLIENFQFNSGDIQNIVSHISTEDVINRNIDIQVNQADYDDSSPATEVSELSDDDVRDMFMRDV